ncbi:UNVERIFIED_CONTAM: hypothetical protein HDU68_012642 [Siphonaria sp. JEL0065]|nr:hypothetical protein HDU68_012642 [Siphonaria sp. JEL0065]
MGFFDFLGEILSLIVALAVIGGLIWFCVYKKPAIITTEEQLRARDAFAPIFEPAQQHHNYAPYRKEDTQLPVYNTPQERYPPASEMDYAPVERPRRTERPLPRGWQAKKDEYGRTFYIDHATQRTTWDRPVANQ